MQDPDKPQTPFHRGQIVQLPTDVRFGHIEMVNPDGTATKLFFLEIETSVSIVRYFFPPDQATKLGESIVRTATGGLEIAHAIPGMN